MISWTGFGWLGAVFFLAPFLCAQFGGEQMPGYRLWLYLAAWAVTFVTSLAAGLLLLRYFPLPPHQTTSGEVTTSHQFCTVELQWAGFLALPLYAVFYFVLPGR